MTQDAYFEKVDKGAGTVGTNAYKEMARRGTMIISLQDGFFKRMGFHADTVASMRTKIMRGTYDGDVDGMLNDIEEVDEENLHAFDEYILTAYPFAEDAHELDKARSTVAPMAVDGDGAAASASASLNDGEWVLRELEHNLAKFKQTEAAFALKKDELAKAEAIYNSKARANADSATSGFCESVVQLIPFIADNDKLMTELAPKIETRRKQVATMVSCPVANVLVNLLVDLSALGATTASIRDDIERKGSIVCGNEGLATVLASDIPSGKGRPKAKAKTAAAAAVPTGAAASALQGLPAAESAYQEYKDKGEVKQLLAADYTKLLALACTSDRYAQPVTWRFTNKAAVRGVCIVSANNNPWMKMDRLNYSTLTVGAAPTTFVDLSTSAVDKARQVKVAMKSSNALSNVNFRCQRGLAAHLAYFQDLVKAGESLAEECMHITQHVGYHRESHGLVPVSNSCTEPPLQGAGSRPQHGVIPCEVPA